MHYSPFVNDLCRQLTLEEKIGMLHGKGIFRTEGVTRLGIPSFVMSDGPMGVRQEFPDNSWVPLGHSDDFVTYFPSNMALAATWNKTLSHEFGCALGAESRGRGKDVILAPGINILRTPLCGRNFEYMSEDPYLISKLVVPFIQGIQAFDVAACVKHFALNNQEHRRLDVNVHVDERALEEIYFPGFKAAIVEGKSLTIMGAYNRFQGDFCCENHYLLTEVLRNRWNFEGIVISDWGAVHSTTKAFNSGLDIEMSVSMDFANYYFADGLYSKVKKGEVSEADIDKKILHILSTMEKLHMFDETRIKGCYNTPEHQQTTLKIAEEAIVLLKNEHSILPLKTNQIQSIAVIGENADIQHSKGGGSAEIKALYEITPLAGIKMALGGTKKITYAKGYTSDPKATIHDANFLREEALKIANAHDLILFVGGLSHQFDTEGSDKADINLPFYQDLLIKELHRVNPNIVSVHISGSPVNITSILEYSQGVLQTWYNGMEGGRALANILFGITTPSGKLPMTFAKNLEDYSSHSIGEYPGSDDVHYDESIYVGYRHFDTHKIEPLFPFGFGLSYTQFSYENLQIFEDKPSKQIRVQVDITNIGPFQGAEVVQLYIRDYISKLPRPYKELKGFEKTFLLPGERKTIEFVLTKQDFSYFNDKLKQWVFEPGNFMFLIGSSSADTRVSCDVEIIDL